MRAWAYGWLLGAVALVCAAGTPRLAHATASVSLEDGLEITTEDGRYAFGVGGRIQQDWAFIEETEEFPADGDGPDGVEFRRARLNVTGILQRVVFFKSQWELTGGVVEPLDVFMGVRGVPVLQTIRVGKQYEPFGLNELTSSNHLVFAERALTAGLAPSRQPGVQAYGRYGGGMGTWAVGVFRDDTLEDDTATSTGDGEYAQTARVTLAPIRSEAGDRVLHLGGAVSHRVPPGHTRAYAFRPAVHLARRLVSTGALAVDDVFLAGAEAAVVAGPFSVQGEWAMAHNDGPGAAPDPTFHSFYAFASVFLTGEHRSYRASSATFGRVRPRRSVGEGAGAFGALELAARVARVDLDDPEEEVSGGSMTDVTLGVNWYLTANARVVLNAVRATVDDVDGALHALVARFHVDF